MSMSKAAGTLWAEWRKLLREPGPTQTPANLVGLHAPGALLPAARELEEIGFVEQSGEGVGGFVFLLTAAGAQDMQSRRDLPDDDS